MGGLGMTGGRGSRGGLATATSAGVHSKLLSQISSGPLRLNPCRQSTPQVQVMTFPSLKLANLLYTSAKPLRIHGLSEKDESKSVPGSCSASEGSAAGLLTNMIQALSMVSLVALRAAASAVPTVAATSSPFWQLLCANALTNGVHNSS